MAAVNGELVRVVRLRKGLTQKEVADQCAEILGQPVMDNLLSKIESGGLGCSPRVVPVLAKVLGLTVDELVALPAGTGDSAERAS
jgi:transcriptional regulator with XRE-family HTH domain